MNTKDKIVEQLKSINGLLGVISTINEQNKPESASIYYISDNDLNIYFVTRSGSRKYKNLMKNPNASFVITLEHPPKTIQIEGIANEVTDANEQINYFQKLIAKASESTTMPPVSQMVDGEMVFMKISTNWARLGNFEVLKEGEKFIETNLF
jgi:nitroimidazol reductase NimA-like FMN-containing flavoprotein (pyridoxamine 5'-phosphate oxidase superfamily)